MTPKGMLTVVGSLDIAQFWPATKGTRSSDGDTVHLKVDPATSFLFQTSPSAKPRITTVFVDTHVNDGGRIQKTITAKSEIKIRLQGIDAPELHYPVIGKRDPSKKGKYPDFRQPYGASAASALHAHLKTLLPSGGGTVIHARFVTQIDKPDDAIDSHGRFVGDVIVGTAGSQSINAWMVAHGWAYPLFYDSMTTSEITTLLDAWKTGQAVAGRPGKALRKPLQAFRPQLDVKSAKLPDGGKLNVPKIFRRQAKFWTEIAGPLSAAQFVARLNKKLPGKPDSAYLLDYFLANASKLNPKKRVTLASQVGAQGQSKFKPEGLVFREDPSTLFDAANRKVTSW